jgi:hypothetical protein
MTRFFSAVLATAICITLPSGTFAAAPTRPATDLPDISLIGSFLGRSGGGQPMGFSVSEIEIAFQQYLFPSIRADVFLAIAREDNAPKIEVEEAYVTMLNLAEALSGAPDDSSFLNHWSAKLGRKKLDFGKVNPLHNEQLWTISRPTVLTTFFGDEGLALEGGQLETPLPLPFFSQLALGAWQSNTANAGIGLASPVLTARWWNGHALSDTNELEWGLSALYANPGAAAPLDRSQVLGLDITWKSTISDGSILLFQNEILSTVYTQDGLQLNPWGGYSFFGYRWNKQWTTGLRYDVVSTAGDIATTTGSWSVEITRPFTETSKIELEYTLGTTEVPAQFLIELVFGMGPHSHVLQ